MPKSMKKLVDERLARLELPFDSDGFDRFGTSKRYLRGGLMSLGALYRYYFRVRVHEPEHVPERGRAMLVANHAGGIAVDAGMLICACFFELEPPRLAQGMIDKFLGRWPFVSIWMQRGGQLTGLPEHAEQLLLQERLLMVFPEGTRGTAKLFPERRRLVEFGTGFLRLALKTQTPIVPVGILGAGEAIPTIANLSELGRLVGAPYVPVTPYGVPFPLPARLEMRFGEPFRFQGNGNEDDRIITGMIDQVRNRIQSLMERQTKRYRVL